MFEQTTQAMRNYDSIYEAASEIYESAKGKIDESYKGALADQKLGEAKMVFESTVQEEKKKCIEVFENEFEETRAKLNEVITREVPSEFVSTLAAVKAAAGTITEYEANAIIDKYKSNYLAVRTLTEVFHSFGKAQECFIIRADSIAQEMAENESLVKGFFTGYSGRSLQTAFMINDQNPLTVFGEKLDKFLSGDFMAEDPFVDHYEERTEEIEFAETLAGINGGK